MLCHTSFACGRCHKLHIMPHLSCAWKALQNCTTCYLWSALGRCCGMQILPNASACYLCFPPDANKGTHQTMARSCYLEARKKCRQMSSNVVKCCQQMTSGIAREGRPFHNPHSLGSGHQLRQLSCQSCNWQLPVSMSLPYLRCCPS